MDVSENSGTPKSSILIGFSIIIHPFWGIPIFGNTHVCFFQNQYGHPPSTPAQGLPKCLCRCKMMLFNYIYIYSNQHGTCHAKTYAPNDIVPWIIVSMMDVLCDLWKSRPRMHKTTNWSVLTYLFATCINLLVLLLFFPLNHFQFQCSIHMNFALQGLEFGLLLMVQKSCTTWNV